VARRVHADLGGVAALGVSEDAFVARVGKPGWIRGADAAGRIRSGTDAAGGSRGSSGGPVFSGDVQQERARTTTLLRERGNPAHLRLGPHGSQGQHVLLIDRDALIPEARDALARVESEVGSAAMVRLFDAMLLGHRTDDRYRGDPGLAGLIAAWRDERGTELLGGRTMLDLHALLANLSDPDQLHDGEHLVGFATGPGRGVYPTTSAGEALVQFMGGSRSDNGYVDAMRAAEARGEPLDASPEVQRELRARLAQFADGLGDMNCVPPEVRQSMPRRADFHDAVARLEAYKLALARGGLEWRGIEITKTGWAAVVARFPSLSRIDFAEAYPRAYRDMLGVLQRIDPAGGPGHLGPVP